MVHIAFLVTDITHTALCAVTSELGRDPAATAPHAEPTRITKDKGTREWKTTAGPSA